jgi:glutathione S-transferase
VTGKILYQFTLSPYCIKVRRILDYKGLPYRTVEVNPLSRGEVVRLSGQKRVPVVVDPDGPGGRTVVADSTAIAEYLDERYPEPSAYPPDPGERARVALLEDWSDEKFAGDLVPFKIFSAGNARRMVAQSRPFYPAKWYHGLLEAMGPAVLRRLASRRRRGRRLEELRRDYERDLDLLDALASRGPFLAGERPTVADFAVWGLLRTMEGLEGEELLSHRPRLAAWYESLKEL